MTWGGSLGDCLAQCLVKKCSIFAFTNSNWHGATGCSIQSNCSTPCTAGDWFVVRTTRKKERKIKNKDKRKEGRKE